MKYTYDLHMHSCLSPCGEEEMSPANLVNMSALLGLDIIALTDHNSVSNCRSAMTVGLETGVLVLPGMELCTSEEIHVVCLFDELEKAEGFGQAVYAGLPPVKNRPDIYGRQLLMDAQDGITGEEPVLLVTAGSVSIEEVQALVGEYDGVCYPAHIDRSSYSVLSALGLFPEHLGFGLAEMSRIADESFQRSRDPALGTVRLIRGGDAHRLEDMSEPTPEQVMELPEKTAAAVLNWLRG